MAERAINGLIGCFAFEKLSVNGSTALTAATYDVRSTSNAPNKLARYASISVETDQIRYRLDGTAPDSSTGHILNIGDVLYLNSSDDIRNFHAIKVTTNATIQVSYA